MCLVSIKENVPSTVGTRNRLFCILHKGDTDIDNFLVFIKIMRPRLMSN